MAVVFLVESGLTNIFVSNFISMRPNAPKLRMHGKVGYCYHFCRVLVLGDEWKLVLHFLVMGGADFLFRSN
jgi:hypothetical protein